MSCRGSVWGQLVWHLYERPKQELRDHAFVIVLFIAIVLGAIARYLDV